MNKEHVTYGWDNKIIAKCEFCDKNMTEEDHHFCDICGECRENYPEL